MNTLHAPDVCTQKWLDVDLVCMLLQFKLISNKNVSGGQPLLVPPLFLTGAPKGLQPPPARGHPHPKLVLTEQPQSFFFIILFVWLHQALGVT